MEIKEIIKICILWILCNFSVSYLFENIVIIQILGLSLALVTYSILNYLINTIKKEK